MVKSTRRFRVAQDTEDRISVLPIDVLHCIISCLPVRDAARTSILSSKWRYLWASCPKIELNRQFSDFITGQTNSKLDFVDIVNKILMQHNGPISKFILDVEGVHLDNHVITLDLWILYLSRNGVKELTLDNIGHVTYLLPYHIFSCPELKHLITSNCFFKLPRPSDGFKKLERLWLYDVVISENILNTPNLTQLAIIGCTGVNHLKLRAPSLIDLSIDHCDVVDLSAYLVMKKLQRVHVSFSLIKMRGRDFTIISQLPKLHRSWPELSLLQLNEYLSRDVDVDVESDWVICSCLTQISLFNFNSAKKAHVSGVMGYLHDVPNLSELHIHIKAAVPSPSSSMEAVAEYLESPGVMKQLLSKLKLVELRDFTGSRTELTLVKLLLASSPKLVAISIHFAGGNSTVELNSILKALLEFRRASPNVEVKLVD